MPSLAQLEKLLAAEPNDPFVLYAIAQEHAKAGDVAKAIGFFDRCLAADPGYSYAYFHKARVQIDAKDVAAAKATIESGLKAARTAKDLHAASELEGLLFEIE